MRSLYLSLSFIFFLFNAVAVMAQNGASEKATVSIEKAYLHTDKSYYASGDTIWYKGYVVSGADHQPSTISNVLNVELVNSRDSVKKIIKVLTVNGLCQGGLALPDSIREGNYRIRAYTTWMRNTGEEYFFDKNIHIINVAGNLKPAKSGGGITPKITATNLQPAKVDVQFFPEGGALIAGLDCKVAFKAVNPSGLGEPVTGTVVDEQNNKVADFSCGKLGMGYFYLNAEANKVYKVKVITASGNETIVVLPKASSNLYAFTVSELGPDQIRVIATPGSEVRPNGELTLIAKAGGLIYYEGKSKPGSNSFTVTLAKKRFPTGIVQFTLLSATGEPLNERLVFIQNNDQLQLDIASAKQVYAPQEKVKIELSANAMGNQQPVNGSFSVSVIDETNVPVIETENNILSNLLLTSDLKGYVENPAYYFASSNQTTKDELDALMLTQGYRKFTWQAIKDETFLPADTGLTISGTLTKSSGKPVVNGKVTLYTMEGTFFAWDTVTNNAGRFAFRHLAFADSIHFVVQSAEKERDRYRINVEMNKAKATPNKNMPDLAIRNDIDLTSFKQNSKERYDEELKYDYDGKARLLKEVIVRDKLTEGQSSSNSILKGEHADYTVTAKQLKAAMGNTQDRLIGLIPGLEFNNNHQLKMGPNPKTPPLKVLVDGMAISDLDMIAPNDIESIEFVYHTTRAGLSGTLIVTLKRGITDDDMSYAENMSGYQKFSPTGFGKIREFYSPQYDNPKTNIPVANLRSTIYWNPGLHTDKDGKTSFEYFNAGGKGTYRIVIEGIDGEGRLGHAEYTYKLE